MKTLSVFLVSMFMFAGLFSVKPAFANPPDLHEQHLQIHNQNHQQVLEANRLAAEELRRQTEEAHLEQLKNHQEFNERQLRRMNRSNRVKPADNSEESNFFEKRRARREARRASKEIQKQEE